MLKATLFRTVPRTAALALAAGLIGAAGCEDITDPEFGSDLEVSSAVVEFSEIDVNIDASEAVVLELRNSGSQPVTVTDVEVEGSDAAAFQITHGLAGTTLAPGATGELTLRFDPAATGDVMADLVITPADPSQRRVTVSLRGRASQFQYRQVDRMGIPGLNTVFNHPTSVAGFDKTAYNLASPRDDLASYTALFETVLGAVGNPDPQATAALLLPDELPVSLGASPTAFANLTGRALSDDAVDVALFVTVGVPGLQSDNVDANDKAFRAAFPYVAAPHQ